MKKAAYILLFASLAAPVVLAQDTAPQTTTDKAATAPTDKGCIAVKPAGSHAFRNIMLAGVAGALISKQQYKVVDVRDYPATVGQKFHGNDLQTIQTGGTRVLILDKKDKATNQCHSNDDHASSDAKK